MTRTACPHCGAAYHVPAAAVGGAARCTRCGRDFVAAPDAGPVPGRGPDAPTAPQRVPVLPPRPE